MSREWKSIIVAQPPTPELNVVGESTEAMPAPEKVRSNASRNWLRRLLWLGQIGIAAAGGYWLAASRAEPDHRIALSPVDARMAQVDQSVTPITVTPVERRKIERAVESVGNLHGYEELTLKTKISGRVAKIYHDFSDQVKPGELLLEIDPTDAALAVDQARRSLNSELAKWGFSEVPAANADLSNLPTVVSARLRSEWTKSQYSRLVALQSRGSVSAEELEQAKTNAAVGESDYANQLLLARSGAATALLKAADLAIAEQNLRETKIYLPLQEPMANLPDVRYRITDRFVTEGAWLAVGTDVFRLVIDETLKLRLPIQERFAAEVKAGQRVEVTTLTTSVPVIGTVTRISPAVDQQTRTFQIEVEIPNKDGLLKSGGFAKARVITNESSDALTVPTSALVSFAGIHKVFELDGEEVREVRVKLGEQTADWIEIVDSQLSPTAQVVTSGQSRLADRSKVRLRETEESTHTPEKQTKPNSEARPADDTKANGDAK